VECGGGGEPPTCAQTRGVGGLTMLSIAANLACRMRSLVTANAAPGQDAPSAGATSSGKDLRRFDTVVDAVPPQVPMLPPPAVDAGVDVKPASEGEADPTILRMAATEAAASELAGKVMRLRELLAEHATVEDEGARIQRAVQRQEEEDSLKFITLLRTQDDAFAQELELAKAQVEEATVLRMRNEADAAVAEIEARLSAAVQEHKASLGDAREQVSLAAKAAAEAAVAETEAKLWGQFDASLAAEKAAASERLANLEVDLGALSNVLSNDTQYKHVSHATHQLNTSVLSVRAALTGKAASATAALRALPVVAKKLKDELLMEVTQPLAAQGGVERFAKVPTHAQLAVRFQEVAVAGRIEALVPEHASGMWGHALAAATSMVTLQAAEHGHTAASAVFTQAEAAMRRGDLKDAVDAVRTLRGAPAVAASGWLHAAEERLLLEQLLTVASAQATIATAALAPY